MKKQIDIAEKYGAITQLKLIIDAIRTSNKGEVSLPGCDYLLSRLADLYKDLNMEVLQDFAGTLNQLKEALDDSDEEGSDTDDRNKDG